MKVGLFFGSFNPIHFGHLHIANYFYEHSNFDEIWIVVSPNNPLKNKIELMDENHRLEMVNLAIKPFSFLKSCDIELSLSKPSFTSNTLNKLREIYPSFEFALILGADNIENFTQWKNYENILDNYEIYVYPRNNNEVNLPLQHLNIKVINAPLLNISATQVRELLKEKKSLENYLPKEVLEYLLELK